MLLDQMEKVFLFRFTEIMGSLSAWQGSRHLINQELPTQCGEPCQKLIYQEFIGSSSWSNPFKATQVSNENIQLYFQSTSLCHHHNSLNTCFFYFHFLTFSRKGYSTHLQREKKRRKGNWKIFHWKYLSVLLNSNICFVQCAGFKEKNINSLRSILGDSSSQHQMKILRGKF